jgi:endonuclease III
MTINDFPTVNRRLKKEYLAKKAPIVDLIKVETGDPFRILVATILSARTKDETTSVVCRRLFKVVRKPHDFDGFTQKQLEKLIHPIGFFHTKAKHLKQLPEVLDREFGGVVPGTIDELCRLPGVGRKTANLVVTMAFDRPAICVDVHVHRICNRLGLLKTQTPLETEMKLREILPKRYWKTWNSYLVSYGQTLCAPIGPRCSKCVIPEFCPQIGVKRSR